MRTVSAGFGLALTAALVSAYAQEPQAPAPQVQTARAPQVQTAQGQNESVQVPNDIPADQMIPSMHLIAGALGVGCQHCHVWGEWAREDKPEKQIARDMLTMMVEINENSYGGEQVVTCYTCHQGRPTPVSMVMLPVPAPPPADAPPPPPPVLPTVDQILGDYVQALGGEQVLREVTSRVITGRRDIPTGPGGLVPIPAEVEIYQKAPNLILNVYRTEEFTISDGFDGTTAWSQNVRGRVNDLRDPDQGRVRRSANFYEALDLTQNYTRMEVQSIDQVGPREAYVVVGFLEDDTPERFYFDTQTGLLLRRAWYLPTAAGPSPYEMDFDDYRDSGGGVMIPFVIRMNPASQRTELGTSSTLRVEKVQHGVLIDDGKFTKPQSPPRAAPSPQ